MTTETTMPPERVNEAESGDAVHSGVLLGADVEKLKYRIGKWKAERANKQREMLILKSEIDTMERLIGEMEDIIK